MARSTCDPYAEIPKGMLKFEVIRSTIRDSIGQYCVPGDMAVLDKKTAKHYLDINFIKVALPEFDSDGEDTDTADEGGTDKTERAASQDHPRRRPAQRRAKSSSDG